MTKIKHIEKTLNQLILERMVCCMYEIEKYRLIAKEMNAELDVLITCSKPRVSEFPNEMHQLLNNFKDLYVCEDLQKTYIWMGENIEAKVFSKKEGRYFELCDRYTNIVCAPEYLGNNFYLMSREVGYYGEMVYFSTRVFREVRSMMNKNKPEDEIEKTKITDDEIEYTLGYLGILEN